MLFLLWHVETSVKGLFVSLIVWWHHRITIIQWLLKTPVWVCWCDYWLLTTWRYSLTTWSPNSSLLHFLRLIGLKTANYNKKLLQLSFWFGYLKIKWQLIQNAVARSLTTNMLPTLHCLPVSFRGPFTSINLYISALCCIVIKHFTDSYCLFSASHCLSTMWCAWAASMHFKLLLLCVSH